ncbi:MAG: isocitrate/isopropylmalate family dehydrogenase [Desulfomicrobium escambiense]|nr:isocitrate/isopropylmalate family dehydrogenase [Desulfomicrobium escambiense]
MPLRGHHLQAQGGRRPRARARAPGQGPDLLAAPSCACARSSTSTTNLRPCKAYPGNPLNYKEGIDLVVFRENTEGLYAGVEFFPVPPGRPRRPR